MGALRSPRRTPCRRPAPTWPRTVPAITCTPGDERMQVDVVGAFGEDVHVRRRRAAALARASASRTSARERSAGDSRPGRGAEREPRDGGALAQRRARLRAGASPGRSGAGSALVRPRRAMRGLGVAVDVRLEHRVDRTRLRRARRRRRCCRRRRAARRSARATASRRSARFRRPARRSRARPPASRSSCRRASSAGPRRRRDGRRSRRCSATAACTGKRASVSPVIAPSSSEGVPPSSWARSITDSTYACEWL